MPSCKTQSPRKHHAQRDAALRYGILLEPASPDWPSLVSPFPGYWRQVTADDPQRSRRIIPEWGPASKTEMEMIADCFAAVRRSVWAPLGSADCRDTKRGILRRSV